MLKLLDLFITISKRDLTILMRNKSEVLIPILFFTVIVSLFPLALSFEFNNLDLIAPGIIWFAALLAILLSVDSIFREDYSNGVLEQLNLLPIPLSLIVFFKILLNWLCNILPLILMLPLIGIVYNMSLQSIMLAIISLILGSVSLHFVGSLMAAITLSLPRAGMLTIVIILPIFVPILLFATSIIWQYNQGLAIGANIALLLAFALASISSVPYIIAKIIGWNN